MDVNEWRCTRYREPGLEWPSDEYVDTIRAEYKASTFLMANTTQQYTTRNIVVNGTLIIIFYKLLSEKLSVYTSVHTYKCLFIPTCIQITGISACILEH